MSAGEVIKRNFNGIIAYDNVGWRRACGLLMFQIKCLFKNNFI